MTRTRVAWLLVVAAAAACTRYELSSPLDPPAAASVVAERAGATVFFAGATATSYRVYAARVATLTPKNAADLPGVVIVDSDRSPVRLDGLAADSQPWYVVVSSLRGGRESDGTPALAVTPLGANAPFFEAIPSWQEGASNLGDEFGSVLAAGDLNGDGRDDLVIGVPLDDTGGTDQGYMEYFLGRASGLPGFSDGATSFGVPGGNLGRSLAIGDFDCDGLDDLAVGSPNENGSDLGFVDIYPGTQGLLVYDHDLTPSVATTNHGFGSAVAAGDANGDGCADLLVGEEGRAGLPPRVYLYLGAPIVGVIDPATSSATAEGNATVTGWGRALAFADLDGDGNDDLVIGEPDRGAEGRVTIFRGPDGLGGTPAFVLTGLAGSHAGGVLVRGGDVDRDGFEDVLGSTTPDAGLSQIFRILGDATITDGLLATVLLEGSDATPLAPFVADVDGDGYDDLLVGDPGLPSASSTSGGGIAVYLGGPAGLSSSAAWTITAPDDAISFGRSLVVGDFDGNGTLDVAGGAPHSDGTRGLVYVHEGFPTRGIRADTGLPRFLAGNGDVNLSDAWFEDVDAGAHVCDWDVGGIESEIDPCTPENVGDHGVYWNRGSGRFAIRLRVTAQDERYGEAFSTLDTEAP